MPLYEYECTACKRHTEKIQKFSDAEITECPHCGGRLERVISAPAVSFKGGGWYADLYSSKRPASGTGAEGSKDGGKSAAEGGGAAAPAAAPAAAASAAPAAAPASSSGSSKE